MTESTSPNGQKIFTYLKLAGLAGASVVIAMLLAGRPAIAENLLFQSPAESPLISPVEEPPPVERIETPLPEPPTPTPEPEVSEEPTATATLAPAETPTVTVIATATPLPPTQTPQPVQKEEGGNEASEIAVEPASEETTSPPEENQRFLINYVKLVDFFVWVGSHLWLITGIILLAVVSVGLVYLQVRGSRQLQKLRDKGE